MLIMSLVKLVIIKKSTINSVFINKNNYNLEQLCVVYMT